MDVGIHPMHDLVSRTDGSARYRSDVILRIEPEIIVFEPQAEVLRDPIFAANAHNPTVVPISRIPVQKKSPDRRECRARGFDPSRRKSALHVAKPIGREAVPKSARHRVVLLDSG